MLRHADGRRRRRDDGATAPAADRGDAARPAARRHGAAGGRPATGDAAAGDAAGARERAPRRSARDDLGRRRRPGGQAIPAGFLGFSFEFQAVRAYTGIRPAAASTRCWCQLIRNLTPGQAPVMRIGGDSTDVSYVPGAGRPPAAVRRVSADAELDGDHRARSPKQLGARMIMGLNLAANEPALAAAEARDYVKRVRRGAIEALEIGNEPNVYGKITVFRTVLGIPVPRARRANSAIRRSAASSSAIAGRRAQAGAGRPGAGDRAHARRRGSWVSDDGRLPAPATRACDHDRPPLPAAQLLRPAELAAVPDDRAPAVQLRHGGLAASLEPWIRIAHASTGCSASTSSTRSPAGARRASATRSPARCGSTDALFSLARAGVDGVDMHTLPGRRVRAVRSSASTRGPMAGRRCGRSTTGCSCSPRRPRRARGC